jgi:hypothetical protein
MSRRMSETPPPLPADSVRQADSLSRALRFTLCALVLGISCFNILSAFTIGKFAAIFNDMLAGKPLPALTAMILTLRPALAVLSLLIPLTAVALLFVRSLLVPVYVSVALALVAMFQLFVTHIAMMLPLLNIVQGMSDG